MTDGSLPEGWVESDDDGDDELDDEGLRAIPIAEFMRDYEAVMTPLLEDVEMLHEPARSGDQHARRNYARAAFAFIEATLDMHTRYLLLFYDKDLSPEELLVMRERAPSIGKNGEIVTKPSFLSFKLRAKAVLKTFEKHHGYDPPLNLEDDGWRVLQESLDVRHRLTHPKLAATSLEITDQEMKDMQQGLEWMNSMNFAKVPKKNITKGKG